MKYIFLIGCSISPVGTGREDLSDVFSMCDETQDKEISTYFLSIFCDRFEIRVQVIQHLRHQVDNAQLSHPKKTWWDVRVSRVTWQVRGNSIFIMLHVESVKNTAESKNAKCFSNLFLLDRVQ